MLQASRREPSRASTTLTSNTMQYEVC
uniref:Uncharacterized protein n=1 Tax=Arundo donax TaxID=35708 RepID=A0A0A9A3A3_ARUDO